VTCLIWFFPLGLDALEAGRQRRLRVFLTTR
jgi:hypothetical protein